LNETEQTILPLLKKSILDETRIPSVSNRWLQKCYQSMISDLYWPQ